MNIDEIVEKLEDKNNWTILHSDNPPFTALALIEINKKTCIQIRDKIINALKQSRRTEIDKRK